jgi:hypothetical protein
MSRKPDESRRAEARRLYHEEKLTRDEVAARLGVRGQTAGRWIDEMRSPGRRKRGDVADDDILELRAAGLSFQAIALELRMSKTGVRLRYGQLTGRERPDRTDAVREKPAREETRG